MPTVRRTASFAQERLWYLAQLEPANTGSLSRAFAIHGPLDIGLLERALTEIARRHEVLRATVVNVEGRPVIVVAPPAAVRLPYEDLSRREAASRATLLREILRDEARAAFDLERGPLYRVRLVRLGADEHVVLLSMHRIVGDERSLAIFTRELGSLYGAYLRGAPSPLAEPELQYADFAERQRGLLQGQALADLLAYWRRCLEGSTELHLTTDRPYPAARTYHTARAQTEISPELAGAARIIGATANASLFMTLLAVFDVLLARHTGQGDVIVGTTLANREAAGCAALIASFANAVPLRADLSDNPRFRDLLNRVRESCLGAYAHQDLPVEEFANLLRPEQPGRRGPLVPVTFTLDHANVELSLTGVQTDEIPMAQPTLRTDLALDVVERDGALTCNWSYDSEIFDPGTIARMAGQFCTLLSSVVAAPDARLSELPLLTPKERHEILVEWNDTSAAYAADKCIHELFEEQAARTPRAVAVVYGDSRLTYEDLNVRANRLARYLRDRGAGPETLVGICMNRSLDLVVALLAILKSGAAYVPLDPDFPRERLAFMLRDARAGMLVTEEALHATLPTEDVTVLRIDGDWPQIAVAEGSNLDTVVRPDNLAYVLYTSGSTGQPKGVMLAHRRLVNLCAWRQRRYGVGTSDCIASVSNITFAPAAWDVFGTLASGACLALIPEERGARGDLRSIPPATLLQMVPSTLKAALSSFADAFGHAEHVFCGGDRLSVQAAQQFFASCSGRLHSLWGATEVGADASDHECALPIGRIVPIGRPIANTRLYLLDAHLEPVPVGVLGELYVGGVGLARGYLNRPGLTAARFVPDPFGDKPGSRLYRTGDLGRYLPDGLIEFGGRVDDQVKVRGFRVELGEIESTLRRHPAVREVAVAPTAGIEGELRLVAYVVPVAGTAPTASLLRSFARQNLPDVMIPTTFVSMAELPRTPTGKIDRRALPEPPLASADRDAADVAPRNPVEENLAGIWSDLLGLKHIGVNDDFFQLGGHSLLATQLAWRVRERWGLELPLRAFLDAPTIAQQADLIARHSSPVVDPGSP